MLDPEIRDILNRCSRWELDALRDMGMPIARGRPGQEIASYKPPRAAPESRAAQWRRENPDRYRQQLAETRAARAKTKHRRIAA